MVREFSLGRGHNEHSTGFLIVVRTADRNLGKTDG